MASPVAVEGPNQNTPERGQGRMSKQERAARVQERLTKAGLGELAQTIDPNSDRPFKGLMKAVRQNPEIIDTLRKKGLSKIADRLEKRLNNRQGADR